MKKRAIITIFIMVLFAVIEIKGIFLSNENSEKVISNSEESRCLLTEKVVSDKELIRMSDLIIRGKILDKAKEFVYEDEYGTSIVSFYNCKINGIVQGKVNSDNIIINFGGTTLPESIDYDEEKTLYLVKSGFVENGKDVYCFSSISQGICDTIIQE